jgi:hypothetical protein
MPQWHEHAITALRIQRAHLERLARIDMKEIRIRLIRAHIVHRTEKNVQAHPVDATGCIAQSPYASCGIYTRIHLFVMQSRRLFGWRE